VKLRVPIVHAEQHDAGRPLAEPEDQAARLLERREIGAGRCLDVGAEHVHVFIAVLIQRIQHVPVVVGPVEIRDRTLLLVRHRTGARGIAARRDVDVHDSALRREPGQMAPVGAQLRCAAIRVAEQQLAGQQRGVGMGLGNRAPGRRPAAGAARAARAIRAGSDGSRRAGAARLEQR
jgi:hypothetical protein